MLQLAGGKWHKPKMPFHIDDVGLHTTDNEIHIDDVHIPLDDVGVHIDYGDIHINDIHNHIEATKFISTM